MAGPQSIQQALLVFSAKQAPWIQDALRRIVVSGSPTRADLDAAVAMCKRANGLPLSVAAPTPVPLASNHLPTMAKGACAPTTLRALKGLENVNALLPGQTLTFAATGITIIYGTNGTGKSGYARVLKHLCRARGHVVPILPNVFKPSIGRPKASVDFDVAGTPDSWTGELDAGGQAPPAALSDVAVFDGLVGTHAVREKQEVTLLPPDMNHLRLLNTVLDHVANVLRTDEISEVPVTLPRTNPGTTSSKFLQSLSHKTSEAELDAACVWTVDDEAERGQATVTMAQLTANNPSELALKAVRFAERIERLVAAIEKAANDLNDEVVARVKQRRGELRDAQQAAALNQGDRLPANLLPGTGGAAWKLMWEAARAYSTESAYPANTFPHAEADSRCVLCQQGLGADAVARLRTFEEFVADAIATKLKEAQAAVANGSKHVEQAIARDLASGSLMDVLDELNGVDRNAIEVFVTAASERRDALLACLDVKKQDIDVPALTAAPTDGLKAAATAQKDRAAAFAATSYDEAVKVATARLNELEDRKLMYGSRSQLAAEIGRLTRVQRRKAALGECKTAEVSKLLGSLTETHVTGALADAFNNELVLLGGKHLAVEVVKTGTAKGTPFTALALKNSAVGQSLVHSVLSEGEQRAVSLAWFFSELTLSSSRSAIVFDDPVSSMDHDWRRKVAARLVAEAAQRQVIVFTHDAVFLQMLHTVADESNVSPCSVQVQRSGGAPGYCSQDVPWEKKKVAERVRALTNDHVGLCKVKTTGTDEEYAQAVVGFLDRLRKTWERAVEECLLNGVIERFGYGVKTQSLAQIDVVTTDYAAIESGMAACSAWVHDPAQGLLDPPPNPDEIAEMVNALVAWVDQLRQRRPKHSLPSLKPIKK